MTLTEPDPLHSVCKRLELPRGRSAELMESLLETMKKTLESGEDVLISGCGKVYMKRKNRRILLSDSYPT